MGTDKQNRMVTHCSCEWLWREMERVQLAMRRYVGQAGGNWRKDDGHQWNSCKFGRFTAIGDVSCVRTLCVLNERARI